MVISLVIASFFSVANNREQSKSFEKSIKIEQLLVVYSETSFLRPTGPIEHALGARLHQPSGSMLRQLCDDAPEWVCNPFSSNSIVFNESGIAIIVAELSQP